MGKLEPMYIDTTHSSPHFMPHIILYIYSANNGRVMHMHTWPK